MFYQLYELNHAALQPARAYADAVRLFYSNPLNPFSHTQLGPLGGGDGRAVRAHDAALRQAGLRPRRPPRSTGRTVAVTEKIVWSRPFCNLDPFRARPAGRPHAADRKLLIVAPMSGHYATLLRGTVEAMLPHADVYITDWADARMVPVTEGSFDLDDYIDYLIDMLARARARHACHGGLPAVGAGAGGRRADGSARRPLRARHHDADGRADRHAPQSDRRQPAGRGAAASTGSATMSSCRCRGRRRASCATSIRASCSSPAS